MNKWSERIPSRRGQELCMHPHTTCIHMNILIEGYLWTRWSRMYPCKLIKDPYVDSFHGLVQSLTVTVMDDWRDRRGGKKKSLWCGLCTTDGWLVLLLRSVLTLRCFLSFLKVNLYQKGLSHIHTYTDGRWLPCKVPPSTSGAVWGSISCPKTRWHAEQGN